MAPGALPRWPRRNEPGVAVGDEADVVAVRLVGDGQAAGGGLLADLVLGDAAEREHGPVQLRAGQDGQHVGLVLGRVHAAQQAAAGPRRPGGLAGLGGGGGQGRDEAGVVAGADRVEAEGDGAVEDGRELDLLVAAQARVGRVAAGVLGDEVLDDVLVEPLGQVPDVERDADHVGGPAGVAGVLERAAAAGAGPVGPGVARQGQVHAGDVVAGLGGPGRGHRGVDAARHRGQHAQSSHSEIRICAAAAAGVVGQWPAGPR